MHQQTFCEVNLIKIISGKDKFKSYAQKIQIIDASINLITNNLVDENLLRKITLKNKNIFIADSSHRKIIFKKLSTNISKCAQINPPKRNFITSNIKNFLTETNPYNIYRYDIKSFFESFNKEIIIKEISALDKLLPINIKILNKILDHHTSLAGDGIPRGLSISTPLSELLMRSFDKSIINHPEVFYYSRYVDDILIITSGREKEKEIKSLVENQLPTGLSLNKDKTYLADGTKKENKKPPHLPSGFFEYLGYYYKFGHIGNSKESKARNIEILISPSKIAKIKKRICRSFISYSNNKDFSLLIDRIKFLTNNFSIYDIESARKKNVGIYFNYPLLSYPSSSLQELDSFLKNAILSRRGKIFSQSSTLLNSKKRKILLGQSFTKGHSEKKYINFPAERISKIKSCWEY